MEDPRRAHRVPLTKQRTILVDDVRTRLVVMIFIDKIFVLVTQSDKMGNLVRRTFSTISRRSNFSRDADVRAILFFFFKICFSGSRTKGRRRTFGCSELFRAIFDRKRYVQRSGTPNYGQRVVRSFRGEGRSIASPVRGFEMRRRIDTPFDAADHNGCKRNVASD